MDFTYSEIKTSLVKFLTKVEKYKAINSKVTDGLVFLIHKNHEYGMIVISEHDFDLKANSEAMTISKKAKINDRHKIKMLKIIINNETPEVVKFADEVKVVTNQKNVKEILLEFFPNIGLVEFTKSKNGTVVEPIVEDEKANQETLSKFVAALKTNRVTTSWAILFLFVVTPIVLSLIAIFTASSSEAVELNQYSKTVTLIFGGTTYSLTILGGQWWRIFTYGLAPHSSNIILIMLFIFFIGSTIFLTTKITETRMGSYRMIAAFVPAYILTGFLASTTLPATITGGMLPILSIICGMLLMNTSGDRTITAKFSKLKSVWPLVLIIIFSFVMGDAQDFLVNGVAIVLGSAFSGLVKPKDKYNWTHGVMVAIIVGIFVTSLVFLLVDSYIPAMDMRVAITLKYYANHNIFGGIDGNNAISQRIGWRSILYYDAKNIIQIGRKPF
ncbi:hypothetical protein CXP39_01540 [Mesoplasma syrphidae]|uniref:Rhomboid family intramembrane serine protease n=1 Tax=Mesoplasma syrphidae TaxID=225999 RepID=A0A2K9BJM1_9MOLU|nr:hypothetical protein [Mesoplasma syrphidae]AUF83481.1 hypothetical protein CXP39_01540 [Mesoplasma syrphidae]